MVENKKVLLKVEGLKKHFPVYRGLLRRQVGAVKAVDGVDFFIRQGETLGLVGESGCGKTTTGRCLMRVIEPTAGSIKYCMDDQPVEITQLERKDLKKFRLNLQMIFQDPFSSLNPRMTVMELVGEPLLAHNLAKGSELEDRVADALVSVGLKVEHMRRYPHSFSGGQRQRIGIARALVQNPRLIVCDEPVSALDVSVQSQVINLLMDLQNQYGLTYLFVAHDMSVVRQISSRIAVMYVGKIVELAATDQLLKSPRHPYTESLLSAIPRPNPHYRMDRKILSGEAADPANPPTGCVFHPRCEYAKEICSKVPPQLEEITEDHYCSCHFAREINLIGVS